MSSYKNETHIYVFVKEFLIKNGWKVIAGEPAGGSDELPRVEIRDRNHSNKGSKGSYKIDLIGLKDDKLLLIEIKSKFNMSDIHKLNEILSSRLNDLKSALLERLQLNINDLNIIKSIAIGSLDKNLVPNDFVCFRVEDSSKINIINNGLLLE